jgi:DNA-binding CsgD family transcriptional regulator/PAS domain-containing protein
MRPNRRKTLGPVTGEELIEVIGSIYEAALDAAQWQTAISRIAGALDAHRAQMFVPDMKSSGDFWVAHNIEPSMMPGYAEYYRYRDLWVLRSYESLRRPGSTSFDAMVVSEAEYLRSEFWNDFTRPIDVFRAACVTIDNSCPPMEARTYLAVYRPRQSAAFDPSTLAFLRTIQPHVLRSLKLGRLLSSAASERTVLQAMLGAVPTPMFACTADSRIRYANDAAEALLRESDGLASDGLRLVAAIATHTEQLAKAVACAAGTVTPSGARTGQTIHLPLRSNGNSIAVTVMPLPQTGGRLPGVDGAQTLVIARHPKRALELACARLRDVYALTAAEATLVAAMLDGAALPQVAMRLGIGHSTARTHMKHIFAKTQTHRQSELLRLVQAFAY